MGRPPLDPDTRLLTPAELEIMHVLWALGRGSISDVQERLGKDRAYTTISTLLRILEQKGFITSHKDGRVLVYAPQTPRPEVEAATIKDMVQRLFDGNPAALVRRLLATETVRPEDRAAIRKLLEESDAE